MTNGQSLHSPTVEIAPPPAFNADRVRQGGYNAANDLQGIYLNYIGSAGGVFQDGDRFAFDNDAATQAFEYLVHLINVDHVAPPASNTNGNGDFSRNQFLAGRMALFQSGTYNLAAIANQARFRWGVAMLPTGPAGRPRTSLESINLSRRRGSTNSTISSSSMASGSRGATVDTKALLREGSRR